MSAATSSRINEQAGAPANPAKRDHRQEVTNSIVNMLEQGVAPWQKPWDGVGIPTKLQAGIMWKAQHLVECVSKVK